jgi:hypothetical protein
MHELHWLPLARAYVLTVLVDRNFVDEFPWTSPAVPKTLAFTFVQSKDSKHVVSGFSRSLAWAQVEESLAAAVVSVLRGKEVRRGDVLRLVCDPQSGQVRVRLSGEGERQIEEEVIVEDADSLISGLHRLFLTDERYKQMFARLCKSSVIDKELVMPEECRSYV